MPNNIFDEEYKADEFLSVVLGFPIISRLFISERYSQLSKIFDQSVSTQASPDKESIKLYIRPLDEQTHRADEANLYLAIYSDFKNTQLKAFSGNIFQACNPPKVFRFVLKKTA